MEENGAGMMGGILGGTLLCMFAIGFALTVFLLAGLWKMFVKAGQPGWAALVPFYNVYVLVQIVGLPVVWFYYYVILIAVGTVLSFLAFFTSVGLLVLSYYMVRMIHRAYGQNDDSVSVIISLFVPIVLTYRAGFGPAQYLGPQSMHDMPNLPWIDSMPARPTAPPPPPPPTGSYIPTLSSNQPNETPLVDAQPVNMPPVSGGPTDPGVDMGSLPQMGNNKDQQQQ
jgi:hypothetical protein